MDLSLPNPQPFHPSTLTSLLTHAECKHQAEYQCETDTETPIDQVIATFHYHSPIDHWIKQLKFNHRHTLATPLAAYMASRYHARNVDVLIPVPLHWRRQLTRGYNQALRLAVGLKRQLNIPLDTRTLKRTRATAAQAQLSPSQRQENVRYAFTLTHRTKRTKNTESAESTESMKKSLLGKHVALIDDVITTGMTAMACAEQLKHAGARRVTLWCLSRAVATN